MTELVNDRACQLAKLVNDRLCQLTKLVGTVIARHAVGMNLARPLPTSKVHANNVARILLARFSLDNLKTLWSVETDLESFEFVKLFSAAFVFCDTITKLKDRLCQRSIHAFTMNAAY